MGVTSGAGRAYPLNSKKLTGILLKQSARGLDIPTSSSRDKLWQLIEGKLEDLGHVPNNTQAVLQEVDTRVFINLQDVDGVFLMVKPIAVDLETRDDDSPGEAVSGEEPGGVDELRAALREAKELQTGRDEEIAALWVQLDKEKERYRKLWSLNYAQFDSAISAKDEEIEQLKSQLNSNGSSSPRESLPRASPSRETEEALPCHRRGRAPPVEMLSGEDKENSLDDCLPALERAAEWNRWTKPELLIQLAGHLKGHAHQRVESFVRT